MISNLSAAIFVVELVCIALYAIWSFRTRRLHLLNRLLLWIGGTYAVWVLPILAMKFFNPNDLNTLFYLDALSYASQFPPALYLCFAVVYVGGYTKLPRWCRLLFIMPVLTWIVAFTNPIHHLLYKVFSIIRSEIVFGPYLFISGTFSYACLITGTFLIVWFAMKNRSRLYRMHSLLYLAGGLIPLTVSALATFSGWNAPITATPLSFGATILFIGIAIYQLHLTDIQPVATQRVLNWISDCYLILSEKGLVVGFNKPFEEVFASRYGITENHFIKEYANEEDAAKKTAIYNMITAVESCREASSTISYEQALTVSASDGAVRKNYYLIDVTPLVIEKNTSGFVVIFKDITLLKKSMQQLQDSRARLMEQERFAFLGQMMGGLAHNLKTPIMSVAGCISAADSLIDECLDSLDDPQVTPDDYREIYAEIRDWFEKARDSTSYMSDIITAIKGQANSVGSYQDNTFTVDELVKRTTLLMRHELSSGGCTLHVKLEPVLGELRLHGDANNLIQVLNNLLSNAIYAQKQTGGGVITLEISREENNLVIRVRDTGQGVSPKIRDRLFREMVTSKLWAAAWVCTFPTRWSEANSTAA